mmetsp:Transcript_10427/g.24465  ORF Transcript_10427/g.24465 Transcript_10427/m.24465 type:complete len:228 (-) Transcript_10427:461-1144(-)
MQVFTPTSLTRQRAPDLDCVVYARCGHDGEGGMRLHTVDHVVVPPQPLHQFSSFATPDVDVATVATAHDKLAIWADEVDSLDCVDVSVAHILLLHGTTSTVQLSLFCFEEIQRLSAVRCDDLCSCFAEHGAGDVRKVLFAAVERRGTKVATHLCRFAAVIYSHKRVIPRNYKLQRVAARHVDGVESNVGTTTHGGLFTGSDRCDSCQHVRTTRFSQIVCDNISVFPC